MLTAKINDKEYKIEFSNNNLSEGKINDKNFILDIEKETEHSLHVISDNVSYKVTITDINTDTKNVKLKINNKKYDVTLTDELDRMLKTMGIKSKSGQAKKELKAPMPGLVVNIPVKKGDFVKQGETLLVLEAMKMENNLKAEHDLTIKDIKTEKGNSVEKNEVLIIFE